MISTGVPECDELGLEALKLRTCDEIPQANRDEILRTYQGFALRQLYRGREPAYAEACKSFSIATLREIPATCPH